MLTRQPLRVLLADDPGAGPARIVCTLTRGANQKNSATPLQNGNIHHDGLGLGTHSIQQTCRPGVTLEKSEK
jgi:hypothetical protein